MKSGSKKMSKSANYDLIFQLGEIRNTFYGSLWNVQSLGSQSKNIAYTNFDLGLHMDLCYFQNPPRFQFLHMLRNKVKGGESIFVDSYKVAEEMWKNHRDLWQALTEVPVGFHYQNDSRYYRYTHPTFEVTPDTSGHASARGSEQSQDKMPRLTAINYSPPFQSPLPLHPARSAKLQARFYTALQLFSNLTLDERFRYERTMVEGECVIFDNRRVLHSRRGFEWSQEEEKSGEGVKRWLKGA
jgi:alpha-ketoglutarate-dependent taurine dioxygenase